MQKKEENKKMEVALKYLLRRDALTYLRDLRNALVAEARKRDPSLHFVAWDALQRLNLACVDEAGWVWIKHATDHSHWVPDQVNYNFFSDDLFRFVFKDDPKEAVALQLLDFLRENRINVRTIKI
jgi:hypothetical protein